jgi:peptide/nickel transport system permease protein
MLHGAPWSLGVGLLVGSLTTATGGALGLLAGVGGRRADAVFLFVCELVQVFPGFLLAIAVAALSPQGGFLVLLLALWLPGWTTTARLVRARVLVLREAEFVAAARAQGWGDGAIARRELLPNLGGILSVQWSFSVAAAILAEAGLSFLGLGAPPGTPSWGAMLQEGRQYLLVAPRLAFLPGALIMGAVLSLQRAGDQLADGLNGNPGGARPG